MNCQSFLPGFFKNIFKIIIHQYNNNTLVNLNSLFHVEANILNLLLLYGFLIFFHL